MLRFFTNALHVRALAHGFLKSDALRTALWQAVPGNSGHAWDQYSICAAQVVHTSRLGPMLHLRCAGGPHISDIMLETNAPSVMRRWTAVMQWLGAPMENVLVFMTACPLLSAFRVRACACAWAYIYVCALVLPNFWFRPRAVWLAYTARCLGLLQASGLVKLDGLGPDGKRKSGSCDRLDTWLAHTNMYLWSPQRSIMASIPPGGGVRHALVPALLHRTYLLHLSRALLWTWCIWRRVHLYASACAWCLDSCSCLARSYLTAPTLARTPARWWCTGPSHGHPRRAASGPSSHATTLTWWVLSCTPAASAACLSSLACQHFWPSEWSAARPVHQPPQVLPHTPAAILV